MADDKARCGFPTERGEPCRNTKNCSWHPPEQHEAIRMAREHRRDMEMRKRLRPQAEDLMACVLQ